MGGSLEKFILDRNFQSRSKSRIFLIFGPSGMLSEEPDADKETVHKKEVTQRHPAAQLLPKEAMDQALVNSLPKLGPGLV